MRLRKITLYGFKSFANRTEISFNDGITCIVGPNGCGKSNILDAVKWVLGTLSPKSLRTDEMQEIIFRRPENKGMMGYAEVQLYFSNDDGKLPIDFSEIVVSRRLYASGESEYKINNCTCRLKDIKDLFYGTGLAHDKYSVIEQGKIDHIILLAPYEMRQFFNEAAGISKYLVQKRDALSRLEKINIDLVQINSSIGELQSQIRSLKIQAGRAEKYKQLLDELRRKKLALLLYEFSNLDKKLQQIQEKIRITQDETKNICLQIKEMQDSIARMQNQRQEMTHLLQNNNQKIASLGAEIKACQQMIQEQKKYLAEIQQQRIEKEGYINQLQQEKNKILTQYQDIAQQMEQILKTIQDAEQSLAQDTQQLSIAQQSILNLQEEKSHITSELEEISSQISVFDKKILQLDKEITLFEEHIIATQSLIEDLIKKAQIAQNDIQKLNASLEEANRENQRIDEQKNTLISRYNKLKEELSGIQDKLKLLTGNAQKVTAKLELLRELESRMEEVPQSVKKILQMKTDERYGIMGLVADYIEVEPRAAEILANVLEDVENTIIVSDQEKLLRLSEYVKEQKLEKIQIIANQNSIDRKFVMPEHSGVLGTVASLVSPKEGAEETVSAIFNNYLLVSDLSCALELHNQNGDKINYLTIQGDILRSDGSAISGNSKEAKSIVIRRIQLKQLLEQEAEIKNEINLQTQIYNEKQKQLEDTKNFVEKLSQETVTIKIQQEHLQSQIVHAQQVLNDYQQQIQQNKQKLEKIKITMEKYQQERKICNEQKNALELKICKLGTRQQELTNSINEHQDKINQTRERISEMRTFLAAQLEKKQSLSKDLIRIENELKQIEQELTSIQQNISIIDDKIQQYQQEICFKENELADLNNEFYQAETQIKTLSTEIEKLTQQINTISADKQNLHNIYEDRGKIIHELEIEKAGLLSKQEDVKKRFLEESGTDIENELKNFSEDGENWDTLAQEIESLKEKITRYGSVNMLAIEDLKKAQERFIFLKDQQTDILNTRQELENFIKRVDKEALTKFENTLACVNEHFNNIFRKIFNGGKSEIRVIKEQDTDPLQWGVEILARPPGKGLTNISLLSGGEKSLTSIALILAMFKANPSPVCFLDEVDSALDEDNIVKFANLIKEFAQNTQFIVITHNKRTMLEANAIVGVTMDDTGVSKIVSVNLDKITG